MMSSLFSFAQKENNTWYFGDKAGIDFNSGTAVPLLNSSMQSFEGTAILSDPSGNVLFYTNGGPMKYLNYKGAVWNKNDSIMPNGILDSSAGGCNSSMQSSLIVPDPGNSNKYYIFTSDCIEHNMKGGFRYSIVDMNLDGGLGDVTVKGVPLTDSVSESICGVVHGNTSDYWVIVHKLKSSSFYAYQINSTGILPPVISNIGVSVGQYGGGQIMANMDGSKIGFPAYPKTMIFNFNKFTGVISDSVNLNVYTTSCCFSPHGRFFYTAYGLGNKIYQFDLAAADIPASVIELPDTTHSSGAMQLGPDGKIYIAKKGPYINVINLPDSLGNACNFIESDFYLGGRNSIFGLPNFIYGRASAFHESIGLKNNLSDLKVFPNPCGDEVTFEVEKWINDNSTVILYNSRGELVKTIENISTDKVQMRRNDLPNGLYLYQVRINKQLIATGKLILE